MIVALALRAVRGLTSRNQLGKLRDIVKCERDFPLVAKPELTPIGGSRRRLDVTNQQPFRLLLAVNPFPLPIAFGRRVDDA